jgi:hypothetical protein
MNSVNPELLKETVVRNFYVKCENFTGHPCSPDSDTDIFTYIEEKTLLRQRPGYILQKGDDPNKNGAWKSEKPNRSKEDFSDAIRTPNPRWKIPFVDQAIEWGNLSIMKPSLQPRIMYAPLGIGTDEVILREGGGDTMFILTLCQTNHWSIYGQDEDYGVKNCGEKQDWTRH